MSEKNHKFNAGPRVFRSILAFIALGGLSFLLGWAAHSLSAGFLWLFWTHLLGPLAMPFLCGLYCKFGPARLRKLPVQSDSVLLSAYMESLLKKSGPQPRLWLYDSDCESCLIYHKLFGAGQRENLILNSRWLSEATPQQKRQIWEALWNRLYEMSRAEAFLRNIQMRFLVAWLSPLAVSLCLFNSLVSKLPPLRGFTVTMVFMPVLRRFKELLFGAEPPLVDSGPSMLIELLPWTPKLASQRCSLLWGPWSHSLALIKLTQDEVDF